MANSKNTTTYFGFALSSSMFEGDCLIRRRALTTEEALEIIEGGVEPCFNPSHTATIKAMESRYGIHVVIPESPPLVQIRTVWEQLLVMSVRGLPRLTDRHEYTDEEIAAASFEFVLYYVLDG